MTFEHSIEATVLLYDRTYPKLGDLDNKLRVWDWKNSVLELFTELKSLRASTDQLLRFLHGKRYENPSYYPHYSQDFSVWSFLLSVTDTTPVFKKPRRGEEEGRNGTFRPMSWSRSYIHGVPSTLFEGPLPPYQ